MDSKRPRRDAAIAAGIALGGAWGFLSSNPLLSYFLALPRDLAEDACEWILRALGSFGMPPDRTPVLVVLHALVFAFGTLLVSEGSRRIPFVSRWLRLPSWAIGALFAFPTIPALSVLWSRRGIAGGAAALSTAALVLVVWAAITTPLIVWVLRTIRVRRAAGIVAAAAVLGVGGLWVATSPSLSSMATPAARTQTPHRLLMIGIDAASWANLQPGIDAGRLPHLAALSERGARGELQSLNPTLSPIVWTTLVTGVEPARHGIRDFAVDGVPYTSNSRRAFALWEVLPSFGLRSAFHFWWASWPAEEVDGRIVSNRFLDRELEGRVFPARDADRLDALADAALGEAVTAVSLIGSDATPEFRSRHQRGLEVLDQIVEADAVNAALGEVALHEDFDMVAVYLRAPDAAGHKFWKWHYHRRFPRLARWIYGAPDRDQLALGWMVEAANEVVDALVGRLLDAAGPDVNAVIVSDHGMTSLVPIGAKPGDEAETGNHHRSGMILLAGPDVSAGARIRGATVYDVFPTILYLLGLPVPEGLPGRVLAEAIPELTRRQRPLRRTSALGRRDVGDPTPIPTGSDESHLDQLRALGYVVD